jgi:hypothetical protein
MSLKKRELNAVLKDITTITERIAINRITIQRSSSINWIEKNRPKLEKTRISF